MRLQQCPLEAPLRISSRRRRVWDETMRVWDETMVLWDDDECGEWCYGMSMSMSMMSMRIVGHCIPPHMAYHQRAAAGVSHGMDPHPCEGKPRPQPHTQTL